MNHGLTQLKLAFAKELPAIEAAIMMEIAKLPSIIHPVAEHVMMGGGKRLRPMLTILFARATHWRGDHLHSLASALEFLHSATLMHDDILDHAELRRGKTAAHIVFGLTKTILAGDVLLALANEIVARTGNPELISCLSRAIMQTATGEIMEIDSLRNAAISRAEYIEIITGKTAYLIQCACEAGVIAAQGSPKAREAARTFGLNLGIAFQLVDDALDYTSCSSTSGKPLGGDLREGKYTLPLLLYLESLAPAQRTMLIEELSAPTVPDLRQEEIITQISREGYAQKARKEAGVYLNLALQALEHLPVSQEKQLLGAVIEFVLTREK